MLAVSPAGCAGPGLEERAVGMEMTTEATAAAAGAASSSDLDFDFSVDDIDFGDFFLRLEDGDALPDLEVDPADIFTDFEEIAAGAGGNGVVMDQEVPGGCSVPRPSPEEDGVVAENPCSGAVVAEENAAVFTDSGVDMEEGKGECNLQRADEVAAVAATNNGDFAGGAAAAAEAEKSTSSTTSSSQEAESRRKSSSGKNSHGKKKAKVHMNAWY
jgi:hypothetical protein